MAERKKSVFLTDEQRQEIIKSKLSNIELVRLYNSNPKTICRIRIEAGTNLGNAGKTGGYKGKLSKEQLKEVLESTTPSAQLADKFKVTYEAIWKIRNKAGISVPRMLRPKVEKVKEPKEPKERKPRVKKPKKKIETKIIRVRKTEPTNKPMKKTQFEEEQIKRRKAITAAETYNLTEKEKIESGEWHYVIGPMRSRILKKI